MIELRELAAHLKGLTRAHAEMGMDPPPVRRDHREENNARIHGFEKEESAAESLDRLASSVENCRLCGLCHGRSRAVFGEGYHGARIVFVGEGPGREEDLQGRPFVGEAGTLLTRIIERGIGLKREDVYICNVVKCRPPGNRDPEKGEIEACISFLEKQLDVIRPEVIFTLGRVAGQALLGRKFQVSRDRGTWHSYKDIPVMPTYHPAYILRNPGRDRELKGLVWHDVKAVMGFLGMEVKGRHG